MRGHELILQWIPYAKGFAAKHFRRSDYAIDERIATALYCLVLAEKSYNEAKGSFVSYLHRTMVNEMRLESWKKRSALKIVREDFMLSDLPPQETSCISEMDVACDGLSTDDRLDLESLIATLEDEDRALVGRVLSGLSYAEIGRELGFVRATISQRMKRIVSQLQEAAA